MYAVQSQNTVSFYFTGKQLLPFDFAGHMCERSFSLVLLRCQPIVFIILKLEPPTQLTDYSDDNYLYLSYKVILLTLVQLHTV